MCASMWKFLLVPLLGTIVPFSHGVPLKPGQPGGPWTEHEVEVTVEKVGPHQVIQPALRALGLLLYIRKGEDLLTGQLIFFTETAVTPEWKVEKWFPRWEINRHAEG